MQQNCNSRFSQTNGKSLRNYQMCKGNNVGIIKIANHKPILLYKNRLYLLELLIESTLSYQLNRGERRRQPLRIYTQQFSDNQP